MVPPWLTDDLKKPTSYQDLATGGEVTWDSLLGKVLTLKRIARIEGKPSRYVFALEDHPQEVYVEGDFRVGTIPHLVPLLQDDTIRDLKARYEGRKVWSRSPGGVCIWSFPDIRCEMSGPITTPLVVKRIERVHMKEEYLGYGGGSNDPHSTGDTGFLTSNPVAVLFDMPAKGLGPGFCGVSSTDPDDDRAEKRFDQIRRDPRKYCTTLWYEVADRWDFERRYSLQPPWESHPEWPKKMKDAVRQGRLEIGMTPEMVVWVWGWPSMYGSIEELGRIAEWEYAGLPAKSDYLYFRHGRLARIESYVSP